MRRLELAAALTVGAFLLLLMPWQRMLAGRNDFVHLYVYGALSGTPELHSEAASAAVQQRAIGGVFEYSLFLRPTFYGVLLKPLARLPYLWAYWIFQAVSAACFAGFLRLSGRRAPELPVLCAMSVPLFSCFFNGQDVTLVLLGCSVSLWLARRERDMASGMVLALCAIKAHLFVLMPLAMLLHKRVRIFAGGVLGCALLAAVGIWEGGLAGERKLVQLLANPVNSPYPDIMPSVRALVGDRHGLFFAAAAAAVGLCVWAMKKAPSYEAAVGWSLVGGLLVSFHAYTQDCLLLLAALAAIAPGAPRRVRIGLIVITLPFFYVLLLLGAPYSASLPLAMLACVGMGAMGAAEAEAKPVLAVTA